MQKAKKDTKNTVCDNEGLIQLIEALSGASRRLRQNAAQKLALIAKENPASVVSYCNEFVDALNRPEAQTRWECLDILTRLVALDVSACKEALLGAETALFDEESGPVRLAAMRFLCCLGATSEDCAEKAWPFIDEGIQCYHGDLEFQDMLIAVIDFSQGHLSDKVKKELRERMLFDSVNSKGALKRRALQIIENVS